MWLIKEAGSCKLYAKGYVENLRHFISSKEKNGKLKRYQIPSDTVNEFEELNNEDFVQVVEEMLTIAKVKDPSNYYEN